MKRARKVSLGKFQREAVKHGALAAKVIRAASVAVAPWVRMKCRFGCGGYGRCLACPPCSPTPEETRKVIACYRRAILVHCDDRWGKVKAIVLKLEKSLFLSGFYKALALGAGPCNLCKRCTMKLCRHPEQARPSMEACGIDVYGTARSNGFHINVVRSHADRANYFGLVLVD